jgi:hypothetical protein
MNIQQKKVVISNEVRGEIFFDLQLKPCTVYKISPHSSTHCPSLFVEMTWCFLFTNSLTQ